MNRKTLLLITLLSSTSVVAYVCPPANSPTLIADFEKGFTQLKTAFTTGLNTLDSSVSTALQIEKETILGAIAVQTQQEAANAANIAHGDMEIAKVTANAIGAVKQSERIKDTALNFSSAGQGYNPCLVLNERRTITETDEMDKKIRANMVFKNITAGTGKFESPVDAQANALEIHHQRFCTADQAAAGLCLSVGDMQGANLQASTLFEYSSSKDDFALAKNSFINNMVGLPDAPLSKEAANTPRGQEYIRKKLEKDALISPALNSLMAIQSEYTSNPEGIESGAKVKPIREQYREQVSRYLGHGSEYQNWNKTLVGQTERGVVIEVLKEGALELALMGKKHEQNERIESMLAALVANENNKVNGLNKKPLAGTSKD
ncbi:hypothetical protein [Acinetobacter sp. Marseille-Q1618]|uniref:hypothetical protein n=1 Tax=Acinetobacter sp. Marseille-Q1618 TaxID=2697502 RepID=UPI0015705E1A|nr:hypothetical protein [Acinetobacter sp. Marseille-Q1618]